MRRSSRLRRDIPQRPISLNPSPDSFGARLLASNVNQQEQNDLVAIPMPSTSSDPDVEVISIQTRAPENNFKRDFVDSEASRDFECVACFEIISNHYEKHTCVHCRSCMCLSCINTYKIERDDPYLRWISVDSSVLECPYCREPFNYGFRPKTGRKSIEEWDNLQVYCTFPSCRKILINREFEHHTNICAHNVKNCMRCSPYNCSQDFHSKFCMEEFKTLQDKVNSEDQTIKKLAASLRFRKNQLKDAESKIKALESNKEKTTIEQACQCSDLDVGFASISNPVRSNKDVQGKFTKFTIKYLDRTFQINNVSLNDPGSVLRAKIEEQIGCSVGAILRIVHTILDDSKLLKQHQFCYKPTVITVLPKDSPVPEGFNLEIIISNTENNS